ncbi:unnamed protein product [Mycena citricolor]|nr:unnamed protein product [Mycena citricolor]
MLSHNPTEPKSVPEAAQAPPDGERAKTLKAIEELLTSPEFLSLGDNFDCTSPLFSDSASPLFNEAASTFDVDAYLTSPMEAPLDDFTVSPLDDSPISDFLTTPVLPFESEADMMSGPLISDAGYSDNLELFGGLSAYPTFEFTSKEPSFPSLPPLYTISPGTPALDTIDPSATSLKSRVSASVAAAVAPAPQKKRAAATGTRKNLKPEALISSEAPTQKRSYVTPSVTSRKAVPASFVQKRLHSAAFNEQDLAEISPTPSEQDSIEWKRRQNTLAARKSRKRKLEHQQLLEDNVTSLKSDVERWRTRAMMAQDLLKANGIACPSTWSADE